MNLQLGHGRVHVPHVPTAERRLPYHPFWNPQHTANSLRQHGCGRHCQVLHVLTIADVNCNQERSCNTALDVWKCSLSAQGYGAPSLVALAH